MTRAQAGDRGAFDDLYLRYYKRLYRFCLRRLHDAHEAEDVAQEAFARAWRALPSFGGDRRFYPWLSVIAAHLCTDVLRRRNRSTPVAEFHQGNVASTEDGGEELALAAVDSAIVAKAFTRLSDRHQRILHLREGSGWSYQKIADHEGVGITAVETLLWRARQALKREFASIAGAEGRMAGILGGVFSMATLRRLFRHATRRVAWSGPRGAMLATMGSAAATAVIVSAVMSGPAAEPVHSPNLPASITPSPADTTSSGATGGTGASATGGSAGGGSGTSASSGASVPGSGILPAGVPGTPSLGSAGTTLGGTVTNLGGGVSNLGGAVTNLGSTLGGVVAGVPLVGSTLGSTVQGVTGTVGGTLNSTGNAVSSTGTTTDTTVAGANGAVSQLLGGVGSLVP